MVEVCASVSSVHGAGLLSGSSFISVKGGLLSDLWKGGVHRTISVVTVVKPQGGVLELGVVLGGFKQRVGLIAALNKIKLAVP